MKEEYRSRVYTDRPAYADLPAPDKFQATMGIIATRLKQHPNAICKRMEAEKNGGQMSFDDMR